MEKNRVLNHSLSLFDALGTEARWNNNNNSLTYKAPLCQETSVALADDSNHAG